VFAYGRLERKGSVGPRAAVTDWQPRTVLGWRRISGLLSLAVLLGLAVTPASAQDLVVSAAISTKEVVEDLGRSFSRSRPHVSIGYNFGSSGELKQQIEAGAPVDLFISAAPRQMDELERRGLIRGESRRVFARNVLAVVAPANSRLRLDRPIDLLENRVGRIVVGDPKIVPAGEYAKESLTTLGLWDRILPKIVFAENVRQALDYVSRGEVEAGFVYRTDVRTRAREVVEAFRLPEGSYTPILYPVAVLRDARQPALARSFLELLTGAQARTVLIRYGFELPGRPR
jgi:molybdate transport system substrate-binding protein